MFLLIDKPKGITSHDVVDQIRSIVSERPPSSRSSSRLRRVKVGHAGTLDPNATGLLIIGVGRQSTKKLGRLAKGTDKTYIAEIKLGEERDTDDAEGSRRPEIPRQVRLSHYAKSLRDDTEGLKSLPSVSNVRGVLKMFMGEQEQMPPAYSAIKIKGKKAYEMARKGKVVNLKKRKVTIYNIDLLEYKYPLLKIRTKVSSGTYIRALARDIGRDLGCGAYLKDLTRTKIGDCKVENAIKLDVLNKNNWKEFTVEF